MKSVSVIVLAIVFLVTVTTPLDSAAQSQNHIRLKVGISTVTGLIGVEYQMSKLSITAGFLGSNKETVERTSRRSGDSYIDASNYEAGGPILIGGLKYAFQPEGRSPFIAASFITNQATQDQEGLSGYAGAGYEILEQTKAGSGHTLSLLAGYRFPIGARFDFTVGAGYGVVVSGDGDNMPGLDIAFGYAIM